MRKVGNPVDSRSEHKLRVGIVGAGFIGTVHARAVQVAGAALMGIADSTPERSSVAAQRLGAERSYDSAEELIEASDVDVVHICTPNNTHAGLAGAALRAGKHVICEKPLATDLDDARALAKLAAQSGRVATVPFVYRFYPMVREVRERIRHDGPGRFPVLHGSYLQDWLAEPGDTNWRVDPVIGGKSRAFADIGVHWCDLLEFTTGHRIIRVSARLATSFHERGVEAQNAGVSTEDAAFILFETDLGASGSLLVSQVSLGRKNRLWFSWDGSKSSYVFDQEQPDSLWIGGRQSNTILMRGSDSLSEAAQRYVVLPAGHPQGYQDCFNAFVADTYAAVLGEQPDGLPTFEDGQRAAAITEAVIEAAASEQWVKVPA